MIVDENGNPITKSGSFLSKLSTGLNNFFSKTVTIPVASQRKGAFGTVFPTGATIGSKKKIRPLTLSLQQIKKLSNTDPIIWSIKKARKDQISQCEWDIVRNTEEMEKEIDNWEQSLLDSLNEWGYEFETKLTKVPPKIYGKHQSDINSIMKDKTDDFQKRVRLKYKFDIIKKEIRAIADQHCSEVKKSFIIPARDYKSWTLLVSLILDDLLVFDAGVIVKNKGADGTEKMKEMYSLPGEEIILYREEDGSIPSPPDYAYVWEQSGVTKAEFTDEELVYIQMNPQQWFYGLSPSEASAYMIMASLYVDSFNLERFHYANVPEGVLNLGVNVTDEQRQIFQNLWEQQMRGGGGLHRMMFVNGAEELQHIPMSPSSVRDMQMIEYLKWTLSIKCACFQISPQDISFTMDLHRTTSEVQYRITKDRGLKSILKAIQSAVNSEIVGVEWNYDDVMFKYLDVDVEDEQMQTSIDSQDLQSNVITINERLKQRGLEPVKGGDERFVPDPRGGPGMVPLAMLEDIAQEMEKEFEAGTTTGEETQVAQPESVAPAKDAATKEKPIKEKPKGKVKSKVEVKPKAKPKKKVIKEKPVKVKTTAKNATKKLHGIMNELKKQDMGDREIHIELTDDVNKMSELEMMRLMRGSTSYGDTHMPYTSGMGGYGTRDVDNILATLPISGMGYRSRGMSRSDLFRERGYERGSVGRGVGAMVRNVGEATRDIISSEAKEKKKSAFSQGMISGLPVEEFGDVAEGLFSGDPDKRRGAIATGIGLGIAGVGTVGAKKAADKIIDVYRKSNVNSKIKSSGIKMVNSLLRLFRKKPKGGLGAAIRIMREYKGKI